MSLIIVNLGFGIINLILGYNHESSQHYVIGSLCLSIAALAYKTL